MYRVLKQEGQLTHRQRSKIPKHTKPQPLMADGPNQVWSWDISYLKMEVRGLFLYLYLITDIWSRKIVGFEVHEQEDAILAALLVEDACNKMGVKPGELNLHQDNGGPMRGVEFKQKLIGSCLI